METTSQQQQQSADQSVAITRTAERFAQQGHTTEAKRLTGVAAMLAAHAAGVTDPSKLRAAARNGRV